MGFPSVAPMLSPEEQQDQAPPLEPDCQVEDPKGPAAPRTPTPRAHLDSADQSFLPPDMLPGPRALRGRLTCVPLPRRRPR